MGKEKTILNGNGLIAEFMNIKCSELNGEVLISTSEYTATPARYHSSWDWLMPVVEKICKLNVGDGDEYVVYAYPRTFGMLDKKGLFMFRFNGFQLHSCETLIEAAWFAVIGFIEWYNINQLKQTEC